MDEMAIKEAVRVALAPLTREIAALRARVDALGHPEAPDPEREAAMRRFALAFAHGHLVDAPDTVQ